MALTFKALALRFERSPLVIGKSIRVKFPPLRGNGADVSSISPSFRPSALGFFLPGDWLIWRDIWPKYCE